MMYKTYSKKMAIISLFVILSITLCLATNSFAYYNTRVPITPDPFEVIIPDEEHKNVTISGSPEPKSVTLSLTSGTVGEHDIRPNERIIYKNNNGYWKLKRNQEISIRLDIVDRHYQTGQMTVVGFLYEDLRTEIFVQQISTGAEMIFFAPRDGNYLFYIDGRSSGAIMVNSLTIQ